MATITTKVDDLDGKTEGAVTVRVAFGDESVDIDLTEANRNKYRQMLAPLFEKGREVTKRGSSASDTAKMREWLLAHGHKVAEKGKISDDLQAVYYTNHPGDQS